MYLDLPRGMGPSSVGEQQGEVGVLSLVRCWIVEGVNEYNPEDNSGLSKVGRLWLNSIPCWSIV